MSLKYILSEYTALITLFLIGAYFYLLFRYDPFKEFLVVIAVSFAYIIWGTIHHLKRVRFYWHVFLEYALIAVLVILLFGFSLNVL